MHKNKNEVYMMTHSHYANWINDNIYPATRSIYGDKVDRGDIYPTAEWIETQCDYYYEVKDIKSADKKSADKKSADKKSIDKKSARTKKHRKKSADKKSAQNKKHRKKNLIPSESTPPNICPQCKKECNKSYK